MNSVSVSVKNWILKRFDQQKISYLKDNFFLDEITAKLLDIRRIKDKDINSFLNPSIKNLLPNPDDILDMKKSSPIRLDRLHSRSNWTPFENWPAIFPSQVYRRGELIAEHGEIKQEAGGQNLF